MQASDPSTRRRLAEFDGPYAPVDWTPDGTALLESWSQGLAFTADDVRPLLAPLSGAST